MRSLLLLYLPCPPICLLPSQYALPILYAITNKTKFVFSSPLWNKWHHIVFTVLNFAFLLNHLSWVSFQSVTETVSPFLSSSIAILQHMTYAYRFVTADFCRINFQKQENWVIRWKYLESCIAIATWFPLRTILFAHPQKFTKLPVSQQFHQQSTDDPWTMLLIFQSLSRFYSMKICRELTAVLPTLC